MNVQQMQAQFWPFARRNWLKIGLVAFVLLVLIQKEISFSVRFGKPVVPEQKQVQPQREPPVEYSSSPKETLTDAGPLSDRPTVVDQLDLFPKWTSREGQYPLLQGLQNLDEGVIQNFIDRFSKVARSEQQKFGIPASIVLASGLLFSQAGNADAVRVGNNFFVLPCTSDWEGATFDQSRRCLRGYESAWMSFRDHSYFITTGEFARLRSLGPVDYQAWAAGLERLGFGETPHLAKQLQLVVERFELQEFD